MLYREAGRVDFSLPNILNWLTKVNPTFECKYVQKGARIVQKMSKKVQEKSLLEQFEIQIFNRIPTATIQCCWASMPNLPLLPSEQNGQKNTYIKLAILYVKIPDTEQQNTCGLKCKIRTRALSQKTRTPDLIFSWY